MQEQIALQTLLRKKLIEVQSRNPRYSVSAFAQRLGLQPSATNEILKGQRRVSRKLAERIADRLLLDPSERSQLLAQFPHSRKAEKPGLQHLDPEQAPDVLKLSSEQFAMISEWVHFAILSLIKTEGFEDSPEWMAKRLGVSESTIQSAVDRLFSLGLLRRTPGGKLKRTDTPIQTSDDVLSLSVQKSHFQDLELAREALTDVPVESRDFSSMTMPVSTRLLPRAKEIIRKAQDELSELVSSEPTNEVYRLCSYFFPLTEVKKHEKN